MISQEDVGDGECNILWCVACGYEDEVLSGVRQTQVVGVLPGQACSLAQVFFFFTVKSD